MSDGERAKWADDLKVLQRALQASPNGGAQQSVYGLMVLVLGAVLGDPVYLHDFTDIVTDAKKLLSGRGTGG